MLALVFRSTSLLMASLVGLTLASACLQPHLLEPTAVLKCKSSSECPDGFFCNPAAETCASPSSDLTPPYLLSVTVTPNHPRREEPVVVEMVASESLSRLKVSLGANAITAHSLTPNNQQGGYPTYSYQLAAPNQLGPAELSIEVADRVGNPNRVSAGVVEVQP